MLSEYARNRGCGKLRIGSVQTQVDYGGNIPDLILNIFDDKDQYYRTAVDHKIFAKESRRLSSVKDLKGMPTEETIVGQLERYLNLSDIDGVAYVRVWPQALDHHVVQHKKYIKPQAGRGMHFFYPILNETSRFSPVVTWLREGFELEGLTPPLNHIPPIYVPDNPDQEIANRGEFAKLLELAAVRAAEDGWRPHFDRKRCGALL